MTPGFEQGDKSELILSGGTERVKVQRLEQGK